jgi:ubiquinone/menaquinone biosynthesis C-methylase UbiE
VPDVLNQQPRGVVRSTWLSSVTGKSFVDLIGDGLDILVCDNTALPFPDDTFDDVITNAVPVDTVSVLGPGVQTSEVQRILKPGGRWVHDGVVVWTKP